MPKPRSITPFLTHLSISKTIRNFQQQQLLELKQTQALHHVKQVTATAPTNTLRVGGAAAAVPVMNLTGLTKQSYSFQQKPVAQRKGNPETHSVHVDSPLVTYPSGNFLVEVN